MWGGKRVQTLLGGFVGRSTEPVQSRLMDRLRECALQLFGRCQDWGVRGARDRCESLAELADCWTQAWRPVLSVCSALVLALVPCVLSALPPKACSVADALAESG